MYKRLLELLKLNKPLQPRLGPDVSCWAFDLNDKILVRLKDDGFKYWQEDYNKNLPKDRQQDLQYFKDKVQTDGYVSFQCWEFMKIFGKAIQSGRLPVFETEVRFIGNEMKPCS